MQLRHFHLGDEFGDGGRLAVKLWGIRQCGGDIPQGDWQQIEKARHTTRRLKTTASAYMHTTPRPKRWEER